MIDAIAAPHGAWKSPITPDLIVAGSVNLIGSALDGADTYWLESRPQEGGRAVLLRRQGDGQGSDGQGSDEQGSDGQGVVCNPAPFNIRNRVHEYGGGSFQVADGVVYFSNFQDQRLYRIDRLGQVEPLTPPGEFRYADGAIDQRRQRWLGVREEMRSGAEPLDAIVAIDLQGATAGSTTVLVAGNDFYASPRLSPDGRFLAWVSWDHPHMPWDSTALWIAPVLADGRLGEACQVAGGPQESVIQPVWSPDGGLYFVSDRNNWWNLYRCRPEDPGAIEAVYPMEAEFGLPHWVFAAPTYAFTSADQIACTYTQGGVWYLGLLDTRAKTLETLVLPYTEMSDLQATAERVVFIAGSPLLPNALVELDLASREWQVLACPGTLTLDPAYLSMPEQISFPTTGGQTAYGLFYPPKNPVGSATEPQQRPPLLVKSHGGPTAAARTSLNLGIQYWTSRGFAVLDVNYRGSTGYGRAYRDSLKGYWGVADVDDCIQGALYLVKRGEVDGDRLAIEGGSAGGYTTLCSLTFHRVFKAGASRYGVSDLKSLATDTHKFESRYLDSLVGPYPEAAALYEARSPIHHVEQLHCPVIFFQGLEDKVVPPPQTERMVEALQAQGLPVAYVAFAEEQHGFRKAENMKRVLEGQLYFFSKVLGFPLVDRMEPVEIWNLA